MHINTLPMSFDLLRELAPKPGQALTGAAARGWRETS